MLHLRRICAQMLAHTMLSVHVHTCCDLLVGNRKSAGLERLHARWQHEQDARLVAGLGHAQDAHPVRIGPVGGAVVRGRKVQARIDAPKEDRPARSGAPPRSGAQGAGADRPARPFERDRSSSGSSARPPRPFERGDRPARPFDKADRPARPSAPRSGAPRGDSADRPTRPFTRDAGPRKFDGGSARPTRPRPPRDDA